MNDLEIIENYLNGQLSADERTRFETSLRTDPAVADALAFYVLTKQVARQEAREQRLAELDALRRNKHPQPPIHTGSDEPTVATPRRWQAPMRWVAAASVLLLLGLGWYIFRQAGGPTSAVELADTYLNQQYGQLSTTMSGGPADRLKQGIDLYNQQKFQEAELIFTQLLTEQPDNDRVLKLAGLVALRQANYDEAIARFHRLSQRTDLYSNPGTFLEALARLKRNQPMDKEQAKKLLDEVITSNLEGKSTAQSLVKQL